VSLESKSSRYTGKYKIQNAGNRGTQKEKDPTSHYV